MADRPPWWDRSLGAVVAVADDLRKVVLATPPEQDRTSNGEGPEP